MKKIIAKMDVKLLFLSDFSWEFTVSGLMCQSVIHTELIFVRGIRWGPVSFVCIVSCFLCCHQAPFTIGQTGF